MSTWWWPTHPSKALIDQDGAESDLFGELERGGLISAGVTRRLACEGSVVVAVDDADGSGGRGDRTPRLPRIPA